MPASWNQVVSWLSRIEVLRQTGWMALAPIDRKSTEVSRSAPKRSMRWRSRLSNSVIAASVWTWPVTASREYSGRPFFVSRIRATRFYGL